MIELPDLRTGYIDLVDYVTKHGRQVSPRGLPIIEATDVTFTVADLTSTLPLGIGRSVNPAIAAIEALQLLAGESRTDLLVTASSSFSSYLEPDGTAWGAYGARVGDQLEHVITKLTRDPATRQAIVTLWDPDLDNVESRRDYPCTVALGFRIRDDKLDLSVLMRSNDLWLGVAYDVFVFTQVQWTLAHVLEVEPGRYTHTAWSLHIYERDLVKCARLHAPVDVPPYTLPRGVVSVNDYSYYELAYDLLMQPLVAKNDVDSRSRWYLHRMAMLHEKLDATTDDD